MRVREEASSVSQTTKRRRKVIRKVRHGVRPAPEPETEAETAAESEPHHPDENVPTDWNELAERAARKMREIADKAMPRAKEAGEGAKRMAVDFSKDFDGAFAKVRDQARDLMSKGQHTRVRLKFRGKQLAELPIAVVAAAEVASFAWLGPLRLIIGHVVGKAVLDIEFVSNADTFVTAGKALLADGELDKAIAEFDKALAMDRKCAGALLGRGIALKLRGDRKGAREWFEKAEEADPRGEAGREARRHLDNL
jgi:tetratricopeptide (TPR) repeat protein